MSKDPLIPLTIRLTPEAFAKFMNEIDNPKPPTQALIDLMRSVPPWDKTPPRS